jgi:hypothetical protein
MTETTYANGKYLGEVIDQGFEETTKKKAPYFFLQLRILGRYDDGGELQDCPRYERTFKQYVNTETGVSILRGQLDTLGVEAPNLSSLAPGAAGHVSLVGRKIQVTCDHEPYEGKLSERWGIPRPRNNTLPLEDLRGLDDKFGHLFRDDNGKPKPPPPAPKPNDNDAAF